MKTLNLLMVICFILFLFVMPVSAFEDDFDDGEIASDWTLVGVWDLNAGGMPSATSNYSVSTTTTPSQSYSLTQDIPSTTINYVSFWVKRTTNTDGASAYVHFSDSQYIGMLSSNTVTVFQDSGNEIVGSMGSNVWNRIEIERSGSNFIVSIYDSGNNFISSQTIAADTDDSTYVQLRASQSGSGGSFTSHFDDVKILSVSPTLTNNINWDLDQYAEGETASYSWTLQNSFWQDFIYKYQIQILKDGSEIDTVKVSQTGIRFQDVNTAGTYEVKLQYSGLFPTNWQTLDSDSVNVIPEVDSYINVPSTSAIKTNFTATYLYGSTPISPIINIKELQNDYTYKVIDTKILQAATAGTTYTTNLSISTVGYHVVDLYDNGQGKSYATDTIQTNYVYVPPFDAVLSSYIDTSMTNYSFGGVISGSYAIEDTNYTDYHTRVEIYNVDKDIISFAYEPLHQIDTFDIPVTDFLFYDDGENVYVVNTNFLSGNNRVQLSAYNTDGSLNEVIAHKNITISATDEEGYGLSLSKYTVVENEVFAIKAITPVQASIIISPLTLMGVSDTTILINGSTQLSHALGMEDTYRISLVSSGETKSSVIITVLEGEEIIPPTEEEEDEVTQGTIDMVIMFLSMPAFWGMIIWVGVVGGAAQSNAVNRSSTGYIAFALGNILAIVGMFAPYTMYILVILWIGAGVFFKLGREAAGSEEY